ncbi:metallophosphatase domain-containing protein [Saprospiraceae bacterium]|nr:metallophosphatase domain-containing protein [Saprospiraceae bacterium]
MKLTLISDTHGQHRDLSLPKGDVLVHAGDMSKRGLMSEVTDFLDWFSDQDYKYKIFIAGNHDFYFEDLSKAAVGHLIPDDVIFLNDSGIEIEGIQFWGSPVQPRFYDWAFNRDRGDDIQQHWDMIPLTTDVLITHGPPYEILDLTESGDRVGCESLTETMHRLQVRCHVFGHIHEAYGTVKKGNCFYANASVLDQHYNLVNEPIVYNL